MSDGDDEVEASAAVDVLITMGGSDPAGMTEFTIDALSLLPMPLSLQVVIGPAFARHDSLDSTIARSKHTVPADWSSSEVTRSTPLFRPRSSSWKTS